MSVRDQFETVDLLLASHAETRGMDAFALSLIKAERQARRLVTYLVYQYPWCDRQRVPDLRKALEDSKKVYFEGILAGWDALYPRSVEQVIGRDYARLKPRLQEATGYRNKIFHGQLTSKGLSRQSLLALVRDIRAWCEAFGRGAEAEVGYDGCGRNSFRKARDAADVCGRYKVQLADVAAYRQFICRHVEG